jgi:hypothetical protein
MSHPYPEPAFDLGAPVELLRLATGYQVAQAIYVAARLGLADRLGDGPKTAEELARETDTHVPSLFRLLRALAAFGVVREIDPDRFALTALGTCLQAEAPHSVRDAVLMTGREHSWQMWLDLLHAVQTGESACTHLFGIPNSFDYDTQHPEMGAIVNAGFVASGRIAAQAVLAAYDFSASGTVVDVAGNQGHLLAAILRKFPSLRGVLFDQPHVVAEAGPWLERMGIAERCTVVVGDFFAEIPPGGDTYLLMRIIHDWEDAEALAILRNCHRAMRPQATLLLVERVLPDHITPSATAQEQTLADLNMLVQTGGKERTEGEYRALFEAAGFALARIIPTQTAYGVVEGVRRD